MNMKLSQKWRPHSLADLIGQEEAVYAIKNILKNNYIHNAFIISGSYGVGKTSIARIFTKCINCESGITDMPCDICYCCKSIDNLNNYDSIEIDAASKTKVEDLKEILISSNYKTFKNRFRTYIIDECHMLSINSFNFLLKILEEDNRNNIYILITTNLNKVPNTIKSRCINLELKKIEQKKIRCRVKEILEKEKFLFDNTALDRLLIFSDGSLRNIINILEKIYSKKKLTYTELNAIFNFISDDIILIIILNILNNEFTIMLKNIATMLLNVFDSNRFILQLQLILYNLILFKFNIKYEKNLINCDIFNKVAFLISFSQIKIIYNFSLKGKIFIRLSPNDEIGINILFINIFFKINK